MLLRSVNHRGYSGMCRVIGASGFFFDRGYFSLSFSHSLKRKTCAFYVFFSSNQLYASGKGYEYGRA
jgi:hypothetical protein